MSEQVVEGGRTTKDYVELLMIDLIKSHALLRHKLDNGLPVRNTQDYGEFRMNFYTLLTHVSDTIDLDPQTITLDCTPEEALGRVEKVIRLAKSHNIGAIGLKKATLT
jgi:hypothetical protein